MKCTYGSHRATLTSFMPLHLFAFLFKDVEVHRTPTMWIAKGGAAMNAFLPPSWDLKVAQRQGETIWFMVVSKMMVIWYQIAKQQLSIIFPYRRWKLIGPEWQALNLDMNDTEQVDVQICNEDDVTKMMCGMSL